MESALIESYDIILRGSTEIPRFESILEPDEDEKPVCLKPTILKEIIEKARNYELEDCWKDFMYLPSNLMQIMANNACTVVQIQSSNS